MRAQDEPMVLPAGACVADALRQLGHAQEAWLASLNGEVCNRQRLLVDGDRLDLYPFLEGG
jgi:sulfur carrier protein ThiS